MTTDEIQTRRSTVFYLLDYGRHAMSSNLIRLPYCIVVTAVTQLNWHERRSSWRLKITILIIIINLYGSRNLFKWNEEYLRVGKYTWPIDFITVFLCINFQNILEKFANLYSFMIFYIASIYVFLVCWM